MRVPSFPATAPILSALCLWLPLAAHETAEKIPQPGFRPQCDLAARFVAEVKTATVQVCPTIIRTPEDTGFSKKSQKQVLAFLNDRKITKAELEKRQIDPGELKGRSQFEWFQNDMKAIGSEVPAWEVGGDYVLVMEVLFPPLRGDKRAVFGVHCIVLNAKGENAFSFLLNSHHRMFVDANMVSADLSGKGRAELVRKATAVGMEALVRQIKNASNARE